MVHDALASVTSGAAADYNAWVDHQSWLEEEAAREAALDAEVEAFLRTPTPPSRIKSSENKPGPSLVPGPRRGPQSAKIKVATARWHDGMTRIISRLGN